MEENQIPAGIKETQSYVVTSEDTAINQKSGEVNVLGTPRLLAMMEEVSYKSVAKYLPKGNVSVGFQMNIQHLKPSFVGETIIVESSLEKQEDRKLFFSLVCRNGQGEVVGQGECVRVMVDETRFENRKK